MIIETQESCKIGFRWSRTESEAYFSKNMCLMCLFEKAHILTLEQIFLKNCVIYKENKLNLPAMPK